MRGYFSGAMTANPICNYGKYYRGVFFMIEGKGGYRKLIFVVLSFFASIGASGNL